MKNRFNSAAEITSGRLRFNKLDKSHVNGIYALRSNAAVVKYTGIKQYTSVAEAEAYIAKIEAQQEKSECIVWAISLLETGEFIGSICLWNISQSGLEAEIGYDCLPQFHGHGYMREAVKTIVNTSFSKLRFIKINACPSAANERSIHLLENAGFRYVKNYDDNGTEMCLYITQAE